MLVQDHAPVTSGEGYRASPLWRDAAVAVAFALAFFLLSLLNPNIPDGYDAYRHVKRAALLIREPFSASADVWHLAYLWPRPFDAWFGYHVLLAPFTLIFDYVIAAKAFAATIFGAISLSVLRLFGLFQVKHPLAWLLVAMAGSSVTLHRLGVARPFSLAILLVLLITLFTFQHRPVALAMSAALLAISYSMFFLAALAPGVWLVFRRDRQALIAALACAAGIVMGLLLNPYFPASLSWSIANAKVLQIAPQAHVEIGGELLPMKPLWFLLASLPVAVAWFAAAVVRLRQWRITGFHAKLDLLFVISALTLLGSIQVGRTFDFFVPFAVLFAATVLSPWLAGTKNNRPYLIGVTVACCGLNGWLSYQTGLATDPIAAYRAPAEYLEKNAPGELVVNATWGDYYYLFFWNASNRFVIGIEPTATYVTDARKYWIWRHLSNNESSTCGQEFCSPGRSQPLAEGLKQGLGARLIFTDHAKHPRSEAALRNDATVSEPYRDARFSIFRVH